MTTYPVPATTALRRRLASGDPLVVPGVADGVAAALARAAGFELVYVSGAATAAARGWPDMSVLALTELTDAVTVAHRASGLGVFVDLDTGYGGPVAVRRAVLDVARAGAVAVHLEDQPFPRRCGYLSTEPCVPVDEMRRRLDAARAAETDLVVVARTDALLVTGTDDAVSRAVAYAGAGAEAVFVNGIRTLDELRAVCGAVQVPVVYNVSGSDRSPWLSKAAAAELGVALVLHPIQAARAAARATERYLTRLAGDQPPDPGDLVEFSRYMDLAGWGEAARFEASLGPEPSPPSAS